MPTELVSIIIPTYNREFVIRHTLESVLNQTHKNWECIIVDDGSTDMTECIVQEFVNNDSRFLFYKRPEHKTKGANSCRNYGFEKSKGKYIQWFDSDDIMHPNKIYLKLAYLLNNNIDFVVCCGVEFDETIENTLGNWDQIYDDSPVLSHITGKISFHTNGPLFRRNFLMNKPLFNENLQRKQEWEFYTRLLFQSTNYLPINKVLYYFRIHSASINGKNDENTLMSRILANKLVFREIKRQKLFFKTHPKLRKHFFDKFLFNIKLALKYRKKRALFSAITGVFKTMNVYIFVHEIKSIYRKPKLLLYFFNLENIK